MNPQQRREPATMDSLAYLLEQILDETIRTRQAIEEQANANETPLYCPPDEHCPGGVRLMKHAPKYWKNDGQDKDRFYHQLPERDYWTFRGEGSFNGATVKNHNVWRSEALNEGSEGNADFMEGVDERGPAEHTESRDYSPGVDYRGEMRPRAEAFDAAMAKVTGQPGKPSEPLGGAPETMRNAGHYMTACLKELKMGRESDLALYGATTINDLPGLMEPFGSWEALYEDTKQRARAAASR